ncbi:MAG: hypothetical protein ABI850_19955 [Flavobacterium sp.]
MKKLARIIITLLLIFIFSCSNDKDNLKYDDDPECLDPDSDSSINGTCCDVDGSERQNTIDISKL